MGCFIPDHIGWNPHSAHGVLCSSLIIGEAKRCLDRPRLAELHRLGVEVGRIEIGEAPLLQLLYCLVVFLLLRVGQGLQRVLIAVDAPRASTCIPTMLSSLPLGHAKRTLTSLLDGTGPRAGSDS